MQSFWAGPLSVCVMTSVKLFYRSQVHCCQSSGDLWEISVQLFFFSLFFFKFTLSIAPSQHDCSSSSRRHHISVCVSKSASATTLITHITVSIRAHEACVCAWRQHIDFLFNQYELCSSIKHLCMHTTTECLFYSDIGFCYTLLHVQINKWFHMHDTKHQLCLF